MRVTICDKCGLRVEGDFPNFERVNFNKEDVVTGNDLCPSCSKRFETIREQIRNSANGALDRWIAKKEEEQEVL